MVPPNTSAEVILPEAASKQVNIITKVKVIKDISTARSDVKVTVGSGVYHLNIQLTDLQLQKVFTQRSPYP